MFVFFQTEESDIVLQKIPDFSCSCCVTRVIYSAFVWKCTDMRIAQAPFWSAVVAESTVL
jgi:hypothetical protein